MLKNQKFRFFVNVQGDEPLILPKDIKKIIDAKKRYKNHVICGYTLINYKEAINNNVPKVVVNNKSNLIYMSRSLVPGVKNKKFKNKITYFKQVCIYAYNFKELKLFHKLSGKSKIENSEDIEILRFLDLNIPVKMIRVSGRSIAVDVKSDINRVIKFLKKNNERSFFRTTKINRKS